MMSQQRKRFFNRDPPRTQKSLETRPSFMGESSNGSYGVPERSLSGSSATLLRQRPGYSPSSPPSASKLKVWKAAVSSSSSSGEGDSSLPQYSIPASSSNTGMSSDFDSSAGSSSNYHLNVNHYSGGRRSSSSYSSKSRNTWDSCHWLKPLLYFSALVGLSVFAVQSHQDGRLLHQFIQSRDTEILQQRESLHQLEHRIQRMRSETINLQSQVEELEDAPNLSHLEMQRKLFHLEHHKLLVEQGIQTNSRRQLIDRFGPGPHYYVEMTVQFDPRSDAYDAQHNAIEKVMIETAHIDDMPHAVQLFLEQVDHGLYDTTAFHINADHVLQAGPGAFAAAEHDSNDVSDEAKSQHYANFVRRYPSLVHVLFQEYSPDMPHREYTLGYPGRPGGPDFYINLTPENERLHGPGGQSQHYGQGDGKHSYDDADPCFARIVQGKEVVDRMKLSQTKPGYFRDGMIHPVTITSMKVVSGDDFRQQQL